MYSSCVPEPKVALLDHTPRCMHWNLGYEALTQKRREYDAAKGTGAKPVQHKFRWSEVLGKQTHLLCFFCTCLLNHP